MRFKVTLDVHQSSTNNFRTLCQDVAFEYARSQDVNENHERGSLGIHFLVNSFLKHKPLTNAESIISSVIHKHSMTSTRSFERRFTNILPYSAYPSSLSDTSSAGDFMVFTLGYHEYP